MKRITAINPVFEGRVWIRLTKREALKAYMNGQRIVIVPEKLHVGVYGTTSTRWRIMNRKFREEFCADEIGVKNDFNNVCKSYEYYNCNAQNGKRLAYYA